MRTAIACLLVVHALAGWGQQPGNPWAGPGRAPFGPASIQVQQSGAGFKTTASYRRLVAYTSEGPNYPGGLDSVRYLYSDPSRGSCCGPLHALNYLGQWAWFQTLLPTRPGQPHLEADSSLEFMNSVPQVPANSYRIRYDSQNRIAELKEYIGGALVWDTEYRYVDSLTSLITTLVDYGAQSGSSTGLQPRRYRTIRLNDAGLMALDSTDELPIGQQDVKCRYHYTADGKLSLFESIRVPDYGAIYSYASTYRYNADGLPATVLTGGPYTATNWSISSRDSFTYAGTSPYYTSQSFSWWNVNWKQWDPVYQQELVALNAAGLPAVATQKRFNAATGLLEPYQETVYTYNSVGDLRRAEYYETTPNGIYALNTKATYNFYYEAYTPLSAPAVAAAPSVRVVALAPNPAAGSFEILYDSPGAETGYQLADATGRVVRRGAVPQGASRHTVAVQDLPAGLYLLTLRPEESRPQTVRVAVMH